MKTNLFRFVLPTAAIILSYAGTLTAGLEYKQPRLELAVQYLQEALKAEDPAPLMRKAKESLQLVHAGGEKEEFCERAITIIDGGLADVQDGKHDKVPGDITTALASIQSAMAHGHNRHR